MCGSGDTQIVVSCAFLCTLCDLCVRPTDVSLTVSLDVSLYMCVRVGVLVLCVAYRCVSHVYINVDCVVCDDNRAMLIVRVVLRMTE